MRLGVRYRLRLRLRFRRWHRPRLRRVRRWLWPGLRFWSRYRRWNRYRHWRRLHWLGPCRHRLRGLFRRMIWGHPEMIPS
ncbi:MAG TPA: hypothetical protein DHU96_20750 [Actinobacteria bacterium]|nr:hypothetical protein [Actinomycetota bacterium]